MYVFRSMPFHIYPLTSSNIPILFPQASDDFEERLNTPEKRNKLTHTQLQAINDLVGDRFARFESPAKREQLIARKNEVTMRVKTASFCTQPFDQCHWQTLLISVTGKLY